MATVAVGATSEGVAPVPTGPASTATRPGSTGSRPLLASPGVTPTATKDGPRPLEDGRLVARRLTRLGGPAPPVATAASAAAAVDGRIEGGFPLAGLTPVGAPTRGPRGT